MVKNVLRAIGGAELYPVISLIIFTLFFAGLLIWVFSLRRGTLDAVSQLALQDSTNVANGDTNHVLKK